MIFSRNEALAPQVTATIDRLFPKFGSGFALDVPLFDPGKNMYLVDQYQSQSGNRYLTYVGLCDNLLIELTTGLFHSWEYIDKVRALVADGNGFRVACSTEWDDKTYFNQELLHMALTELLTDYVCCNTKGKKLSRKSVEAEVERILDVLLTRTPDDLDRGGLRRPLETYCRQMNLCSDFTSEKDFD